MTDAVGAVVPGGDAGPGTEDGEGSRQGKLRELEVESVAVGGDGVAREESGRVVFLPRAAPGDRVVAEITEDHGSFARAEIREIVDAGPQRKRPPCRYYETCGGCQLQHLEYPAQLEAKRTMVRDVLERIGGREAEVLRTVPAARRLGYRNRVTFTLRRLPGSGIRAGYFRRDVPDQLLEVESCPLAEEAVNRAWRELRACWGSGAAALPGGRELRITIRASVFGRVTILVEGGRGEDPGVSDRVAGAVTGLSGYFWRPDEGERRRLTGREEMAERWMDVDLSLPPEAFLQVNREMSRKVEARLDELVAPVRDRRILDLYSGVGVRALRWARAGARVEACEIQEEAVRCGRQAASSEESRIRFHRAPVEEAVDDLLPADVVVVNPPRRGLSRRVTARFREGGTRELAYVSCDPATLARDIRRLGERWTMESVVPFDVFPQTAHVETVTWMRRTS